jgi:ABC-2 type transport system permease protein
VTAIAGVVTKRCPGHYRLAGVLRSEWTKFWSARSAQWLGLGFAVTTIAAGVIFSGVQAAHWAQEAAAARAGFDSVNVSFKAALTVGQLAVGAVGVLAMTDEYATGMIRSSLAAVPSRPRLLAAKAVVVATVTLLAGEAVTVVTFLAGQAVLRSGKAPSADLGQPGVLRAIALSGAYLALLALLGLGLGLIIRHTAGAVAAYATIMLVVPLLLAAVPGHLARFTPATMLTSSVAAVLPQAVGQALPPGWIGFFLMAAYAAAALLAGAVLFWWRDA